MCKALGLSPSTKGEQLQHQGNFIAAAAMLVTAMLVALHLKRICKKYSNISSCAEILYIKIAIVADHSFKYNEIFLQVPVSLWYICFRNCFKSETANISQNTSNCYSVSLSEISDSDFGHIVGAMSRSQNSHPLFPISSNPHTWISEKLQLKSKYRLF